MGVVVAAVHVELEQPVAIKSLRPEVLSEEARARFLREARAVVKLRSEHVARVIDVGTLDSGAPYMVMEYLEGRDLGGILHDKGPLSARRSAALVLQACEGLAAAHAAGVVHRDVKPSNLFLTRSAHGSELLKILDFGISKVQTSNPDIV